MAVPTPAPPATPTASPATPVAPNPYATAALPVPGTLPPGNYGQQATAIMNPIYSDANQRLAANTDALNSAITAAQQQANARVQQVGAAVNAQSPALAQVSAIPQEALQNIQTRAMQYNAAQQQALAGGQTAETAGLANTLNAQTYAGEKAAEAAAAKDQSLNLEALVRAAAVKPMYTINTPQGPISVTGGEALTYQNEQNKAASTTAGQTATLQSDANTKLQALLDPQSTGTVNANSADVQQAEKGVLAAEGPTLSALGITPAELQQSMNAYLCSLKTPSGGSASELTGSYITLGNPSDPNAAKLPSLTSQVPGGVQSGSALERALTEYQMNAGVSGQSKAALLGAITKTYGSSIANQVRQAAASAGANLSDYLYNPGFLGSNLNHTYVTPQNPGGGFSGS